MPKETGWMPTEIVVATIFVVVLITDAVLEKRFTTKTSLPSGVTATPSGSNSTVIVVISELVAVSITDTVLEKKFET